METAESTPRGDEDKNDLGLTKRLLYGGFDSDNLTGAYGKSWSAYYKIAGMADRFSIFGGNGVGVYNAGSDGDATAFAVSFRIYGEHWYAALVLARTDNVETTDQYKYVNGRARSFMLNGNSGIAGGSSVAETGSSRMLYGEYRIDNGILYDGTPRRNELTLGFRWDFGH